MTPFADTLNDEDIASVLSFIRNSWGNKAPLVEVSEVKKMRAQYKDRGGYMDVPELMKIQLKE
jgi:mono/diheme cytochrome c family protein